MRTEPPSWRKSNEPLHRVELQSLPVNAASRTNREIFLFSCYVPEKNRYIIRHINPETKKGEELEFDLTTDRVLSLEERLQDLPDPRAQIYADKDLVVYASYYNRPPSNELWVHFDIYSESGGQKIAEADQQVYPLIEWDINLLVANAVNKANFPVRYSPHSIEICCSRVDGLWEGVFLESLNSTNKPPYRRKLSPKTSWEKLWSQLVDAGLLTLPDSSQLKAQLKDRVSVRDGISYVVEGKQGSVYRAYAYLNPDYQKWREAKQMLRMADILYKGFGVKIER